MSLDVLSHFGSLDELVQVVYQGFDRFVLLSAVDDEYWTLHLALSGSDRWWRGKWASKDIVALAGAKPSPVQLDAFATQLADAVVQGTLGIDGWPAGAGAQIMLALAPSSPTPIRVEMSELSAKEAAAQATSVLLQIALQARERHGRLHAPAVAPRPLSSLGPGSSSSTSNPIPTAKPSPTRSAQTEKDKAPSKTKGTNTMEKATSKATLAREQRVPSNVPAAKSAAPRAAGASLANPSKKARRYQEIEFESDSE